MELTSTQLQALDAGQPVPIEVDGRQCVLLSNTKYDAACELIEDWHPSTMLRQLANMMAEDWTDPAMSVYDE